MLRLTGRLSECMVLLGWQLHINFFVKLRHKKQRVGRRRKASEVIAAVFGCVAGLGLV